MNSNNYAKLNNCEQQVEEGDGRNDSRFATSFVPFDLIELKAFIGILLLDEVSVHPKMICGLFTADAYWYNSLLRRTFTCDRLEHLYRFVQVDEKSIENAIQTFEAEHYITSVDQRDREVTPMLSNDGSQTTSDKRPLRLFREQLNAAAAIAHKAFVFANEGSSEANTTHQDFVRILSTSLMRPEWRRQERNSRSAIHRCRAVIMRRLSLYDSPTYQEPVLGSNAAIAPVLPSTRTPTAARPGADFFQQPTRGLRRGIGATRKESTRRDTRQKCYGGCRSSTRYQCDLCRRAICLKWHGEAQYDATTGNVATVICRRSDPRMTCTDSPPKNPRSTEK